MRRVSLCVLVLSLAGQAIGCAGASGRAIGDVAQTTSGGQAASVTPEARISAIESQLAETTAETRSLRSELMDARARGGSVHIGEPLPHQERQEAAADFTILPSDDEPASSASRPTLRLYGQPVSEVAVLAGPQAPSIAAAPPLGALGRLPVVLVPGTPDSVPAIPMTPVLVAPDSPLPALVSPREQAIAAEYRVALAHVSAREWELALATLASFVSAHPDHPYADNAMYWRGEVLYARRDYAGAITELSSMIQRFPRGNKVPDALLRIGFAYQRLGEGERAREIFRRVREQYPGTVAARTASREDA